MKPFLKSNSLFYRYSKQIMFLFVRCKEYFHEVKMEYVRLFHQNALKFSIALKTCKRFLYFIIGSYNPRVISIETFLS